MARAATASPAPAHFRFPTPSPFSVASSLSSSSTHFFHVASLSFRSMAVIFSFISALMLARPSHTGKNSPSSFMDYPQLVYCFIVTILALGYSALQLIKGICDIAHRGFILTEKVSDYTTFILDQLLSYLLISSCTLSMPVMIQHVGRNSALWAAAWTSSSMSFATFFVMASSSLLSGYRLCKRVIW